MQPIDHSPAAPPLRGKTTEFSGEVSRGRRFEKEVGAGLVFRLEPYAGNDSGWDIRLAPAIEPSPAAVDCIGAIEVPRHGSDALSIELPDDDTEPAAALRKPREFDFVPNAADCRRAWDLSNAIGYDSGFSGAQQDELNRQLGAIPVGQGQFHVVDERVTPSTGAQPAAIQWIKFEVQLHFVPRQP